MESRKVFTERLIKYCERAGYNEESIARLLETLADAPRWVLRDACATIKQEIKK